MSGLSTRARSVFRVVTSLSPPFVMESNLDEDGLCLRGLPCHRMSTSGERCVALFSITCTLIHRLKRNLTELN